MRRRQFRPGTGASGTGISLGRRVATLAAAGALLGGGGVFTLGLIEHSSARDGVQGESAASAMLSAILDQDAALQGFAATENVAFNTKYSADTRTFQAAELVATQSATTAAEVGPLTHAIYDAQLWEQSAEAAQLSIVSSGPSTGGVGRTADLVAFREQIEATQRAFAAAGTGYWWLVELVASGAIVIFSILIGFVAYRILVRPIEDARRATSEAHVFVAQQAEFADAIQMAESEGEVHSLLKRQLERLVPGAHSTILRRNNSINRLVPVTDLPSATSIDDVAGEFEPRDCLAVRFGRSVQSADTDDAGASLERCEICSRSGREQRLCVPSLVRGEVIGSVLVAGDDECSTESRQRVESTIAQASPVLGNLRTLALAERQAATDGMTGLANNRSFRDVLKRYTALADRAGTPLSALMLDIDHFKKVNDNFGHDRGDQALAAIAAALAGGIRASDFAARYGGEEFVILLPNTDLEGALSVAETLRTAVASMPLAGIGLLTVSVGVATMPDHATDADTLVRAADGALYLAKERGRNRVEVASRSEARSSDPRGDDSPELEGVVDLALT